MLSREQIEQRLEDLERPTETWDRVVRERQALETAQQLYRERDEARSHLQEIADQATGGDYVYGAFLAENLKLETRLAECGRRLEYADPEHGTQAFLDREKGLERDLAECERKRELGD